MYYYSKHSRYVSIFADNILNNLYNFLSIF